MGQSLSVRIQRHILYTTNHITTHSPTPWSEFSRSSEEELESEEELPKGPSMEDAQKKQAEIDARKAEVRKRLEEQSAKKQKKGFMTPERKKKLRMLLRKKAAEELKKEQERKAQERRRIIDERCGQAKNLDGANEEQVKRICEAYQKHIMDIESDKYDIEKDLNRKELEINELNTQVNDLRGKFIKPTLKKVSKYENKFAKLQKKAAEFNFKNQLKTVKKKEFEMPEDDPNKGKLVTDGEAAAES